jgi:hypothetical protein
MSKKAKRRVPQMRRRVREARLDEAIWNNLEALGYGG